MDRSKSLLFIHLRRYNSRQVTSSCGVDDRLHVNKISSSRQYDNQHAPLMFACHMLLSCPSPRLRRHKIALVRYPCKASSDCDFDRYGRRTYIGRPVTGQTFTGYESLDRIPQNDVRISFLVNCGSNEGSIRLEQLPTSFESKGRKSKMKIRTKSARHINDQ